ncbi:MAG: coniferyl aldehyde dehydrogenase [Xanthomonadales bacterium]|nr:coniferyl aldehyde dehydrogenase [Gammaproteobacteria bacterium]MBT8055626.1 coniferyl aldehyde dehydrogenase [Gammaproteobacteria bacterium]NNL05442.1 coniferyl aldehyde dehydrogenase [Xanthomonadales bacterium]
MSQPVEQFPNSDTSPPNEARRIFDLQKAAYLAEPYPDYATRVANLEKLEAILTDNRDAIADAISKDFGNRACQESLLVDVFLPLDGLRYCRKHLKRWMKPQKRKTSIWFKPASNTVLPQPKGVVGVIAPWNYPLFLVVGPLASALAAGNRCMVKMASNSQNLCRLFARLVAEQFNEDTLAVLPGVRASEFTPLPWDHLIFTGSPESGKTVMKTAAENLTPVTLELGGKSPTIVCDDYNLETAAERIIFGKFVNAGQTCVGPDYLFLPENKVGDFVTHCRDIVGRRFNGLDDPAYTSIADDRSFRRLSEWLEDAQQKGASAVSLMPGSESDPESRKMAPMLITGVDEGMLLMQDEIFGPLLPIKTYRNLDDALEYINTRERPLALYLFTGDRKVQDRVIKQTISGGVCLNDCVLHAAQHDMPFGGIGNSGMGHYHAREGFNELSKLRPIFRQANRTSAKLLYPPYGKTWDFLFSLMMKLKI